MGESHKVRQMRWIFHEKRPLERLREEYDFECILHNRLMSATQQERKHLYTKVYDELLRKFPDNGMLAHKLDKNLSKRQVRNAMRILRPWLRKNLKFLEIGPGNCSLSFEVCKHVEKVYGVDVSYELTENEMNPKNFKLIISDGTSVPIDPNTIDLAYSNQYMEHIHPEDMVEQLENIFAALKHGGIYICRTPHKQSGPHDISKWFSETTDGMHLIEYTYNDLNSIFRRIGFKKVKAIIGARGYYIPFPLPIFLVIFLEKMLGSLPFGKELAHTTILRAILGMQVVAIK